jgi:hypothetical protein
MTRRYAAKRAPDSSLVSIKPEVGLPDKVRFGVIRRVKRALLPQDKKLRQIPLGLARGLRYRTPVSVPPYRYIGLFEYEIAAEIRALCQPGSHCWDVGGADGYYALVFSKLTEQPVVTFEADPDRCEALRRMCEENPGIGERVQIHQTWVGSTSDGNGHVALDDVVQTSPAPDVLKIDVEGAEHDVLRGATSLLSEHRPAVIVEVHSQLLEHECLELLLGAGYTAKVISQRRRMRENRPLAHNRWIVARPV